MSICGQIYGLTPLRSGWALGSVLHRLPAELYWLTWVTASFASQGVWHQLRGAEYFGTENRWSRCHATTG